MPDSTRRRRLSDRIVVVDVDNVVELSRFGGYKMGFRSHDLEFLVFVLEGNNLRLVSVLSATTWTPSVAVSLVRFAGGLFASCLKTS